MDSFSLNHTDQYILLMLFSLSSIILCKQDKIRLVEIFVYSNKQFYLFDSPTKDLLSKIYIYPVLFFANARDGITLMANEHVVELFWANSPCSLIGRNLCETMSEEDAKKVMANNVTTINNDTPQLFYEECLGKECLSIKTRLYNSCNNIVGVGGFAFYFHHIAFKDIITLISKLVTLHPITHTLKYNYIFSAKKYSLLSYRERECVYYLTKSMTYKEIAKTLSISPRTVETHIEHIKNKLGCYSRSDIVSRVFETKE